MGEGTRDRREGPKEHFSCGVFAGRGLEGLDFFAKHREAGRWETSPDIRPLPALTFYHLIDVVSGYGAKANPLRRYREAGVTETALGRESLSIAGVSSASKLFHPRSSIPVLVVHAVMATLLLFTLGETFFRDKRENHFSYQARSNVCSVRAFSGKVSPFPFPNLFFLLRKKYFS